MRILFVDHETRLSGGQRDLVDLATGLGPTGLDLHAALPGDGPLADALREEGVTVHHYAVDPRLRRVSRWQLARRPWSAARHAAGFRAASRGLAALARRLRPDVVHSNSLKAHLLAIPAARATPARHVWHVRDILERGWLRRGFARAAGRYADALIVLSEAAAAPFQGTPVEARLWVIYNGIRARPVRDDEVATWRARLGASNGEPLVGMVGQIAAWKGQDVFVEAATRVADRLPQARFVVVGECLFPENEAAYEEALRRRCAEGPLTDRLVWAGPVEPVEPVMAACDVLVHASRLPEPFGRVIVEAMAQGTPVVTTSVGAGAELVGPRAGVIVPPGDARALGDALLELLDDPDLLTALGIAARSRAASLTIERTASAVLDLYTDLDLRLPSSEVA